MFFVRNLIELLRYVRPQVNAPGKRYHICELPIEKQKASARRMDRSERNMIVVHITGINGGFGTSPRQVKAWAEKKHRPLMLTAELMDSGVPEEEIPRKLALFARYRNLPYHRIVARSGAGVINRPEWQRTYHAGAGNDGLGFALDMGHKDDPTAAFVIGARAALREMIEDVHSFTMGKRVQVTAHRNFTSPRRRGQDPGGWVWRRIVLPVVHQHKEAFIDYKFSRGDGVPIPRSWDTAALYDDKGRRL